MWLKKFFQENVFFLYPFLAFVSIGSICLYLWPKDVLLLAVNSRYSTISDLFFKYYTHVGDGRTCILLAVLMFLFLSKYKGIVLLMSYALSSIPTQLVKIYLFQPSPRPKSFFWLDYDRLHFVEGVEVLVSNSFPSGHTSAAFAMLLVFSHFVKNKMLSFLFFVMALLTGYSRMYLALHFFADTYAGSIIAVIMTILSIYLAERVFKWKEKKVLQSGLLYTL